MISLGIVVAGISLVVYDCIPIGNSSTTQDRRLTKKRTPNVL